MKDSYELEGKLESIISNNLKQFVSGLESGVSEIGSLSILYVLTSLSQILDNLGIGHAEIDSIFEETNLKWWGKDIQVLKSKL